ncbi:MAG: SRPBCC family protein [Chitinophagaceae bacterium]
MDSVWKHVGSFAAQDQWSPWNDYDPKMKKSITGTDGTVGAISQWESDVEEVGKGNQKVTKVEAPTIWETDLTFTEPFESKSLAYMHLSPEGAGTKVTWGFKSKMPYPFNISKLFMNMDAAMDKDFGSGLNKLKSIAEQQ